MKLRSFLVGIVSMAATGCAAYELPPLSRYHPASSQATSAPAPTLSKTLAYTRSDIPASRPAAASRAEQEQGGARAAASGEQQTVVGEGKVIATVPNASQIVVDHAEIKGFMEAMTMGYRVDPPSLLEGLKFGDKVRFTIDVPKKAIVKIEKLN